VNTLFVINKKVIGEKMKRMKTKDKDIEILDQRLEESLKEGKKA